MGYQAKKEAFFISKFHDNQLCNSS